MKKWIFFIGTLLHTASALSFMQHAQKLFHFVRANPSSMVKKPLHLIKKSILERNEPFYIAGGYLVLDKIFFSPAAHSYFPLLLYLKSTARYICLSWIFYTCFCGSTLDEIKQELKDIKDSNQTINSTTTSTKELVEAMGKTVGEINQKLNLNEVTIKKLENIIIQLKEQLESAKLTGEETNILVKKLQENNSTKEDLKKIEEHLELIMKKNYEKIESLINQKNKEEDPLITDLRKKIDHIFLLLKK